MSGLRCTAITLMAGLLVSGCASSLRDRPSASEMDGQARIQQQEYVIGARDQLAISVWKQPDLSLSQVPVRLDGRISFPLLDDVEAAGRTTSQLKEDIARKLTEFVTAPHVTVVVLQINSKFVYVMGEVARKGPIVLIGEMRVIDALSTSGGFSAFADRRRVKIIRNRKGAAPVEFEFDYGRYVSGKDLEQNILLIDGDRIVVPDDSPLWR